VFLAGVAFFGLASAGAALSVTPSELIAARLIEGAAAGALVPQVLATFRLSFDHDTRLKAFGVYGAVTGLAAAVGVILGGVLTQYSVLGLGWRAIFWINVPISLLVLAVAAVVVPETRATKTGRLDLPGGVILATCLSAIAYPLLQGRNLGWPTWSFALLACGLVGLAMLAIVESRRERRGTDTLVQISQFRYRAFAAGIGIQELLGFSLQGFSFTFILWIQEGHHYGPLHAGLTLVAFATGGILTAPTAGKLAAKRGRRVLATGGALMAAGTLIVATPAFTDTASLSVWPVLAGLLIAGAGLGWLIVPLVNVVLAAVPVASAGGASGTFNTAQQLGGAIGIAICGTVFFAHTSPQLNLAFTLAAAIAAGSYTLATLLCIALPTRAVTAEEVIEVG
jgi:MFS family permease